MEGTNKTTVLLLVVSIMLVLSNIATIIFFLQEYRADTQLEQERLETDAPLIYPFHYDLSREDFANTQRYYRTDYQILRQEINNTVSLAKGQSYAYYFESLNTGAWVGLNEKNYYLPLSLRKVPLIAAVLNAASQGQLSIDDPVTITPADIDTAYGPLGQKGPGAQYTIRELMHYVTYYSDNTAAMALLRVVGEEEYLDALLRMGVSVRTIRQNYDGSSFPISAKEYSNILRSLYYSSYLSRSDSEMLLTLLTNTSFTKGLPAGTPNGTIIAHKIADVHVEGALQYHDCGIIYYPHSPYILCIMTNGMDANESNRFIARLSKITYDEVDRHIKS